MTICDGKLIVHLDGSVSCTAEGSFEGTSVREAVARHRTFVPCSATHDATACPVCSSAASSEVQAEVPAAL